jgi:hypothetical protein
MPEQGPGQEQGQDREQGPDRPAQAFPHLAHFCQVSLNPLNCKANSEKLFRQPSVQSPETR